MNRLFEIIRMYHDGGALGPARRRIATMLPLLNERQRRLYLACEASALGPRGVAEVTRITGAARETVLRGMRELEGGAASEMGAGRSRKWKERACEAREPRPDIMRDLKELIGASGGEALSYTCRSVRSIGKELRKNGLGVSDLAVTGLLKEAGYSPQPANRKTAIGRQHPDLEAQFRYIDKKARLYMGRGEAVLHIDLKKPKAGAGPLAYGGGLQKQLGAASPYGVYRLFANAGYESAALEAADAAFAAGSLREWWSGWGAGRYGRTGRALITGNFCWGSAGLREFQALADDLGLELSLLCFPPGTARWESVGQQYFSFRGPGGGGEPLISGAVIVTLAGAGRMEPGAVWGYAPGFPASRRGEAKARPHEFRGEWNLTVQPRRKRGRPSRKAAPAGPGG